MNKLWFLIGMFCVITEISSKSCLEEKIKQEKECLWDDEENYIECVKRRMKRQASSCKYDEQCSECDCDFCQYSQCEGQCDTCCNSCCDNYVQCHTNHCCHKQCHSECRTYSCRSSCRKSCYNSVSRETGKEVDRSIVNNERIVEGTFLGNVGGNNTFLSNTSNVNAHNITTVINLKNVINNTNVIDVPINVNYTNKNNISITDEANNQWGSSGSNLSDESCCIVIGPRQCVQTQVSPFVRCFHLRSKQCGSYCSSTIVHKVNPSCTTNAFGKS